MDTKYNGHKVKNNTYTQSEQTNKRWCEFVNALHENWDKVEENVLNFLFFDRVYYLVALRIHSHIIRNEIGCDGNISSTKNFSFKLNFGALNRTRRQISDSNAYFISHFLRSSTKTKTFRVMLHHYYPDRIEYFFAQITNIQRNWLHFKCLLGIHSFYLWWNDSLCMSWPFIVARFMF